MSKPQAAYLIRPIMQADAPTLLQLVKKSTGGLSSLQPRLDFLQDYIAYSEASFAASLEREAPHKYLLGLIDVKQNTLIGCAAVKTQVGIKEPFINFDIIGDGAEQYLRASSRFKGVTEVGSLFLDPAYRAEGLGRYLAKSRYMLMATEPWRFGDTVIAELRGICGAEGSPLYDHLFAEKLEQSFLEADAEYFDRNPQALGDIVPLSKIPVADLPQTVRASLAQPHESGRSAMRLLQDDGFIFSGTIDLFDGGPIMSCFQDTLRTPMESQLCDLQISPAAVQGDTALIATGETVQDFQAIIGQALVQTVEGHENLCLIGPEMADVLSGNSDTPVHVWQQAKRRKPRAKTALVSQQV